MHSPFLYDDLVPPHTEQQIHHHFTVVHVKNTNEILGEKVIVIRLDHCYTTPFEIY